MKRPYRFQIIIEKKACYFKCILDQFEKMRAKNWVLSGKEDGQPGAAGATFYELLI